MAKHAEVTVAADPDGLTPARREALEAAKASAPPTPPALQRAASAPARPKLDPDAPACHNCRHWLARAHINAQEPVGACRRYPPPAVGMRPGDFPITKASTVCGEHAKA